MNYKILWTEKSLKQLKKLDKPMQKRIIEKVDSISYDPFSHVTKLVGLDFYRLRVGDYRIIMTIENGKMVIFVLEIGHRGDIYKKY